MVQRLRPQLLQITFLRLGQSMIAVSFLMNYKESILASVGDHPTELQRLFHRRVEVFQDKAVCEVHCNVAVAEKLFVEVVDA